jgi:hypothetical protein
MDDMQPLYSYSRPTRRFRSRCALSGNQPQSLGQKASLSGNSRADTVDLFLAAFDVQLFDRRLQFNGAVYDEEWPNVQLQIYDAVLYGNSRKT